MQHHRATQLTRFAEEVEAARVVEEHLELPLTTHTHAVDAVGGFKKPWGIAEQRVRAVAEHEAVGVAVAGLDQVT